jgi:hypothetical protein
VLERLPVLKQSGLRPPALGPVLLRLQEWEWVRVRVQESALKLVPQCG